MYPFLLVLSFAISLLSGAEISDRADLIFFGGEILTVNEAFPTAEAIAVRRGKILAVGKKSDAMKWKGEKTELIDLKESTLLPGFIGFKPYSEQFESNEAAKQMALDFAKHGYTTVTDLGLQESIDPLKEIARGENPIIRLQGYVVSDQIKEIQDLQKDNDDRFRILGVKIWSNDSKLNPLVLEARKLNLQISVRANEDEEVKNTMLAFENALQQYPKEDHRFRIEHAAVTDDQLLERMHTIKATPSFTNQHVYCWGAGCKDQEGQVDVAATAKKMGIKFTLSDASPTAMISPLLMLEVVATRELLVGGVLKEKPSISIDDAIKAMTLYAAWQTFREKELGSIEVGKQADFVLLSKNPNKVDPRKIKDIEVVATWINGKKVQP